MKRMTEQDTKAADARQAIDEVLALAGDGRMQDALALLTPPVAAIPRNRNQVRRLVVAPAMRAGELDTARLFLERLVEANPSSSDDLLTLGSVMMRAGRRDAGQAHIERAGELDPDNLAIAAVRLQGASPARIILGHVVPMCLTSVVVRVTLNMASIILTAAGLGFLGLGAQPPSPEWGAMLSSGRQFLMTAWWIAAVPGCAILLAGLAFNLFGDGLRDIMDPRNG